MEDTLIEDGQNGRRPKCKTTQMETKLEDDQNGRQLKWKTTKMEELIKIILIKIK